MGTKYVVNLGFMNLDGKNLLPYFHLPLTEIKPFNYECRQQTVVLAEPATLSPTESTDISYHITVIADVLNYCLHSSLL